MTETPGAQTQAAKAAARKRPRRPADPKAEVPPPESVEAKANEALNEMGWPAPTPEQWDEALKGASIGAVRHIAEFFAPTVHQLWIEVMRSVRSIAKGDFNEDQGFKFRGVDAVVDKVGAALREVGVHIRPRRILEHTATEYTTRRGARMVNRVVRVEWEVTGPQGDSFLGESMGEAADAGDKSMSKAQSVAYRTYLLQALNIPTGERDPDADAHERDTPAAGEGYYWDQQQNQQVARQRPSQPQQSPSQDERRQAQAGEENQAAQPDVEEARKAMWVTAKGLGWEWNALAARFKSDHDGRETKQATREELEAFTAELVREAEQEEDRAKRVVQDELGGRPVEDAHTTGGVL